MISRYPLGLTMRVNTTSDCFYRGRVIRQARIPTIESNSEDSPCRFPSSLSGDSGKLMSSVGHDVSNLTSNLDNGLWSAGVVTCRSCMMPRRDAGTEMGVLLKMPSLHLSRRRRTVVQTKLRLVLRDKSFAIPCSNYGISTYPRGSHLRYTYHHRIRHPRSHRRRWTPALHHRDRLLL
jgi:hypothetical protein